jgi:hypothetical protein
MNPIDTLYYVARAGYEPEEGGRAASWEAGHPCLQAIHTVPPSLQLGMVLQAGGPEHPVRGWEAGQPCL